MRIVGFPSLGDCSLDLQLKPFQKNVPICTLCCAVKPELYEISEDPHPKGPAPPTYVCLGCIEFRYGAIYCRGRRYVFQARILIHAAFLHRVKVICPCRRAFDVIDLAAHRRRSCHEVGEYLTLEG